MAILLFWEKDQFVPASPLRGSADLSYKGRDSRGFTCGGRAHGGRELCVVRASLDEASSHSPTAPSGATVFREQSALRVAPRVAASSTGQQAEAAGGQGRRGRDGGSCQRGVRRCAGQPCAGREWRVGPWEVSLQTEVVGRVPPARPTAHSLWIFRIPGAHLDSCSFPAEASPPQGTSRWDVVPTSKVRRPLLEMRGDPGPSGTQSQTQPCPRICVFVHRCKKGPASVPGLLSGNRVCPELGRTPATRPGATAQVPAS